MSKRPLKHLRGYDLKKRSVRICRNCCMWQSADCPYGPNADDPAYKTHPWSSQSACEEWKPNDKADAALQELTMRALRRNINVD